MTKFKNENILKKIRTRKLKLEDYKVIASLQLLCFPDMIPWKLEQFQNIVEIFPSIFALNIMEILLPPPVPS